ncbi:MAG: dTDP-4-dehydrorhamnose 3,5-epimerase [Euryarchaeota archaeon]|nr:dTDP-4-dehydrorhamnose 3,5-epimerase [Euryarchaeota archaeon]
MAFTFRPSAGLPDVVVIGPNHHDDDRGWFEETYKESAFKKAGIPGRFVQDNHTRSREKGTLRGLHFQKEPAAQGKLVRCLRGEFLDVAVDVRRGSPTYGRSALARLSAENRLMVYVPPGFAHGVQTLVSDTDVAYKVTAEYSPEHERAIRWDDPELAIPWPMARPILSAKDAAAPLLGQAEHNFVWKGGGNP